MDINLFSQPIAAIALSALIFNLFVCREALLQRTFRTPLALTSRAIDALEQRYNRPELTAKMRRADGLSTIVALIFGALFVGIALGWVFERIPMAWLLEALIVGMLIVMRSHLDQIKVLSDAMDRSTSEARATLALLSGAETDTFGDARMVESAVRLSARTMLEGFLAPVFYFILAGLPGLLIYRVINTAYVMIDEQTEYAADFGWAAKRLNQWLIWPISRLAAGLVTLTSMFSADFNGMAAARGAMRDHPAYLPEKTGWTLAAVSGALGMPRILGPEARSRSPVEYLIEPDRKIAERKHIVLARKLFLRIAFTVAIMLAIFLVLDIPFPADFL